jgi:hypothetical protein
MYLVWYLEAEKRNDRRNVKLEEDRDNATNEGEESAKEATENTTDERKDSVEQANNGLTVTKQVRISTKTRKHVKATYTRGPRTVRRPETSPETAASTFPTAVKTRVRTPATSWATAVTSSFTPTSAPRMTSADWPLQPVSVSTVPEMMVTISPTTGETMLTTSVTV